MISVHVTRSRVGHVHDVLTIRYHGKTYCLVKSDVSPKLWENAMRRWKPVNGYSKKPYVKDRDTLIWWWVDKIVKEQEAKAHRKENEVIETQEGQDASK